MFVLLLEPTVAEDNLRPSSHSRSVTISAETQAGISRILVNLDSTVTQIAVTNVTVDYTSLPLFHSTSSADQKGIASWQFEPATHCLSIIPSSGEISGAVRIVFVMDGRQNPESIECHGVDPAGSQKNLLKTIDISSDDSGSAK